MENLLDIARRVLDRHPCPAIPYTELHRLICLERPGPRPDPDFLLRRIRTRPDLFRIVEPWRGPWRRVTGGAGKEAGAYRRALARAGLPVDLWIVAAGEPRRQSDAAAPPTLPNRLRTTLLGLSRGMDADSPGAMARWSLLVGEQSALWRRLSAG